MEDLFALSKDDLYTQRTPTSEHIVAMRSAISNV
jgi:hypothetical protein